MNEHYEEIESNERQYHENVRHQEEMDILATRAQLVIFDTLKPSLERDGNQWCVLYGEDLQVGISGFGSTPFEAILDFNTQWYKEIESKEIPEFEGTREALKNLSI